MANKQAKQEQKTKETSAEEPEVQKKNSDLSDDKDTKLAKTSKSNEKKDSEKENKKAKQANASVSEETSTDAKKPSDNGDKDATASFLEVVDETPEKKSTEASPTPAVMPPPGSPDVSSTESLPTTPPPKKNETLVAKEQPKSKKVSPKETKKSSPKAAATTRVKKKSKKASDLTKQTKKKVTNNIEKSPLASKIISTGPEDKVIRRKARKVRRVVRHIDPWSVLTFAVLFHIVVLGALFVASLIMFVVANWFGMISSFEEFMVSNAGYDTYEIKLLSFAKFMAIITGVLVLISSIMMVLLTVIFNLISDLVGGIRVTVVEEDLVTARKKKVIK